MCIMSDGRRVVSVIGEASLTGMLIWLAMEDGKNCRLKNRTLMIYSITGIIMAAVRVNVYGVVINLLDYSALALLLAAMQKLTKGQIGSGDIWVLAGLPLYIEEISMWESIWNSLLLMAAAAMIVYIKERDKKAGLPYIPFLCAGVIITMWRNLENGFY